MAHLYCNIVNDDTDYSDEFDDDEEDGKNTDCDQTPEKAEEVVEERQVPEISAENHPTAEAVADSGSSRELTIVEQSDNAEITKEPTLQQQKVDKVLTFLTVTFCFFVISGLVMKIFLYLIGLIFLFLAWHYQISADYIVKFSLTLMTKREKIVKSLLIHLGISFGLSLLWALLMRFIDWMLKTFLEILVMFIVGCVLLFALFMITLGQLGYSNRHS